MPSIAGGHAAPAVTQSSLVGLHFSINVRVEEGVNRGCCDGYDRPVIGGPQTSERNPTTRLGLVMAAVAILTPLAFWLNLPWARVAAQLPGVGV